MIVKFLTASATFKGITYNLDKVSLGIAELMITANFDALSGLNDIRPTDYINYLAAMSALNKGISEPQLHVAISTEGQQHSKIELAEIAAAWMVKMGYGKQPYLVVFHYDTENNHVHIVSTRVDHEGRKISSGFERVRAMTALNQIMGLDEDKSVQKDLEKAKSYRFSTLPQFKLILEKQGYTIKNNNLIKFGKTTAVLDFEKITPRDPDMRRAAQLKAIFEKYKSQYDTAGLTAYLKTKMGIELVFHSKDGKPTYGYTIIDHAQKNVYKGSQVMPLKELLTAPVPQQVQYESQNFSSSRQSPENIEISRDIPMRISISRDIDDEAIHGRRRRKKGRANQR